MSEDRPISSFRNVRSPQVAVATAAFAAFLLGVLYFQSQQTLTSVTRIETDSTESIVHATRQWGGQVEYRATRLPALASVMLQPQDDLVEVGGVIVDVVDRKGVPFIVILGDDTGTAEVVYFDPPESIKDRVSLGRWMDLTARIGSYKGELQLRPVSPSLISVKELEETPENVARAPIHIEAAEMMKPSATVSFIGEIEMVKSTRSGKSVYGRLRLENGDSVNYFWSSPPSDIRRGLIAAGYARVDYYRGSLQLKPYGGSTVAPR